MYGGIEDATKDSKIMPTGDIYTMKLYPSKCSCPFRARLATLGRLTDDLNLETFQNGLLAG